MRTDALAGVILAIAVLHGAPLVAQLAQPADARPAVTTRDLMSLNDLAEGAIRIAPTGRYVAYQVYRAEFVRNDYSSAWYVVSTAPGSLPRRVADGGDARFDRIGQWEASPPVWAPDGMSFLYLCRQRGALQVWRAYVNRRPSEQITHNAADVREAFWSRDGREILFSTGLARADADNLAMAARMHGILVDSTIGLVNFPWDHNITPGAIAERVTRLWVNDLRSGREYPADSAAAREFRALEPLRVPGTFDFTLVRRSPNGRRLAYAARVSLGDTLPDSYGHALFVKEADEPGPGKLLLAGATVYSPIEDLWWSADGSRLYFSRPVLNEGRWALFAIDSHGGTPERVGHFAADESAFECSADAAVRFAACIVQRPTVPPNVGIIDLASGTVHRATDLNPRWRHLDVQPATLLTWTNRFGHMTFGHLVKPRGYVPGRRYPLVITTYRSEGFLRGGVGDEYPIQPLAAAGFMVLSFNATHDSHPVHANHESFERTLSTWTSPTASLEQVVRLLADSGLVDTARVGLTGLSYGAMVVSFAISHSRSFTAAIESGCSADDPIAFWLAGAYDRWLAVRKLGDPDGPTADGWRRLSPALNAAHVRAPLLVNAASNEVYCEMQFYGSLKVHQKPVELHVYPDERHIKNQPMHRLEIYQRNIDWFNFWFHGIKDSDPAKAGQYRRWRTLRKLQQQEAAGDRTAIQPVPQ